MALTKSEQEQLEQWLAANAVGNMPVERPTTTPVAFLGVGGSQHQSQLGAAPRLSESSRKRYAQEAAKKQKKREAYAKRKLPSGRFHHNSKKRTRNKAAAKRWETQPLKSLTYGYGSWDISQEEWDRWMGPFWQEYPADRLYVKRRWGHGTKKSPYRIYHLKLFYQHYGKPKLLWDGTFLEDLYLSSPNELDLALAHEGAELFLSTD